jgi:hypothetical protein
MRGLLLEGELLRLLDRFAEEGIEVAILKGIPQQREIYGRLGTRRIADNDLLVRRRDVARAAETLTALGYAGRRGWSLEEALAGVSEYCFTARRGNATAYVDLHWEVIPAKLLPISEEDVWSGMRRSDLRGRPTWTPDVPLGVMIACYQVLTHIHEGPERVAELGAWWSQISADDRRRAHAFAGSVECPEVVELPLRIAWLLDLFDEEPTGSVLTRLQARPFASRLRSERPVDGLLKLSGRLVLAGRRRLLPYLWSRVFVSRREAPLTPGGRSKWSHFLGPHVGRVINAVFPRP